MKSEKMEKIIKMTKEINDERYIDNIYKYVLYYYLKKGELPPKESKNGGKAVE